jgi:hypothetical protein
MIWEQDREPLPVGPSRGGRMLVLDSPENRAGAIDRRSRTTQYG